MNKNDHYKNSLKYHEYPRPGKIATSTTKSLNSKEELALAYSPFVAAPCLEIEKDEFAVYKYTGKGNSVAVITNGTAVLGLGNIGTFASKPVMEGKVALFKKFSDIDAIDLQVKSTNIDEFVNTVKNIGDSWGGINLEDIKSPECFLIEEKLQKLMNIPIFHDDQHGTAIIVCAGLINSSILTNRKISELKIVINGAGAAAIACIDLLIKLGINKNNVIVCDRDGVIFKGREERMNFWKKKYATDTNHRTLKDTINNADVFLGLSVKDVLTKDMVASMNKNPIIFAMANPDPEIMPGDVVEVRDDAIIATGRSDYKNQVNNVMAFPYIFRGALDTRSTCINDQMKIATANAIAKLARQDSADGFNKDHIIPTPFDNRLMIEVPIAVAKSAIESGVAMTKNFDIESYRRELLARQKMMHV